jgi:hypothetical protein
MKISKRKRDILIIIISLIILVILIFLGFFYFRPNKKPIQAGGYDISENDNNKIVENKEYGLYISFPKDWTIKDNGAAGVGAFSPEIELDESGGFLQSAKETGGCIMGTIVRNEKETSEYLELVIAEVKNGIDLLNKDEGEQTIVNINGKEGLKTTYLKDGKPIYIKIEIPIGSIIYEFDNGMIFSDKCTDDFNKILDTVIINK